MVNDNPQQTDDKMVAQGTEIPLVVVFLAGMIDHGARA